ncbi:unnamed protein product [Brassica rapa]|uniref:Uncharacterized protein n=1 Tax=Brassica campestris TaxID=3711 RepID=A0A3P5Z4Y4_BRACM|nr:unnamed protein product [Brassica rapa]VDC67208.1 unnamed protein product [Brassica rapa]
MSPKEELSREQKGKAIATESSPAKDLTTKRTPLDEFNWIHHDAMMETVKMELSQRLLVAGAARQFREEENCAAGDGQDAVSEDRDGTSSKSVKPTRGSRSGHSIRPDFFPTCYYPGGIFEELPVERPNTITYPEDFFKNTQAITALSH